MRVPLEMRLDDVVRLTQETRRQMDAVTNTFAALPTSSVARFSSLCSVTWRMKSDSATDEKTEARAPLTPHPPPPPTRPPPALPKHKKIKVNDLK